MTMRESCGSVDTHWATCVAVASLIALSGCTAVKVKLGMRVYLAKTLVSSMPVCRASHRNCKRSYFSG